MDITRGMIEHGEGQEPEGIFCPSPGSTHLLALGFACADEGAYELSIDSAPFFC